MAAEASHSAVEAPPGYMPNPYAGAPHQPEFLREKAVHEPDNFYRGYC